MRRESQEIVSQEKVLRESPKGERERDREREKEREGESERERQREREILG